VRNSWSRIAKTTKNQQIPMSSMSRRGRGKKKEGEKEKRKGEGKRRNSGLLVRRHVQRSPPVLTHSLQPFLSHLGGEKRKRRRRKRVKKNSLGVEESVLAAIKISSSGLAPHYAQGSEVRGRREKKRKRGEKGRRTRQALFSAEQRTFSARLLQPVLYLK